MATKTPLWLRVSLAALFVSGTALLVCALLAQQLGIDHDAGWGTGRILLAVSGVGCLLLGLAVLRRAGLCAWAERVEQGYRALRPARSERAAEDVKMAVRRARVLLVVLAVLGGLVYAWYITAGTWTRWQRSTVYFDLMAEGFLHGQTALLVQPSPELLALQNPYDYQQRKNIDAYLWDASFYKGRYHLYWGPVPGVLLALFKLVHPATVADLYLVYVFVLGSYIFSLLLLYTFWRRWFTDLPPGVLLPGALVAAVGMPVLWLVERPAVYEVAVAGAQCFLLAGVFWLVTALEPERPRRGRLVLAGASLGLVLGTRASLTPAVAVLALLAALWLLRRQRRPGILPLPGQLLDVLALGGPLALCAAGVACYNYVRFDSIFEFGLRYQLTGLAFRRFDQIFSWKYIIPNLYSYLFRPLTVEDGFPFFFAIHISEEMWPFFIRLPEFYYYPEQVAGLLLAQPYVWFALPALVAAVRSWRKPAGQEDALLRWLLLCLAATVLVAFGFLLVFVSVTMRYQFDFTPLLVVLASLGYWLGRRALRRHPLALDLYRLALLACVLVALVTGLAIGVSGSDKRFETLNPALLDWLRGLFS